MAEEEEKVVAFLDKLKILDAAIYNFQEDIILNSSVVRGGVLDRSEAIKVSKLNLRRFKGRAPLQGLNVGDANNMSHDDLDKITNNFTDCMQRVRYGLLFRGFMDDGQEVTVKTWNFMFPAVHRCVDFPRYFHLTEFGWKERMKVATDYALLMKTLTLEKLDLFWTSVDIMIDEEYNIKLVNYVVNYGTGGTWDGATDSDDSDIGKAYIFEFGILLLELITKRGRAWERMCHLSSYIKAAKGGSAVHETLEVDAATGTEITKLIGSCVCMESAQRPDIDCVISELKRIVGSGLDESL